LSSVLEELRDTVAVRWRRELAGTEPLVRRHWTTKTNYYEAVDSLLAADRGAQLSWQVIVDEVQPRGSRTTFFDVAGRHAKRPLRDDYAQASGPVADLAGYLQRDTAPELLVDETKVWSYWPHRVGWLHQLVDTEQLSRPAVAECLVRVLLDWADRQPHLAVAHEFSPPICAVEDLVVIQQGRLRAARCFDLLRDAIRQRVTPPGCSTDGVLHTLRDQFAPPQPATPANRDLAAAIDRVTRDHHSRAEQSDAVAMMREAIAVLEAGPGAE